MGFEFKFDPKVVAREGAVFSPNDGLEYPEALLHPGMPGGDGKRRMVACPPTGARKKEEKELKASIRFANFFLDRQKRGK